MTENKKRYVYHQSGDFGSLIEDTKENKCLHFMSQATEELNALHEENEQLKKKLDFFNELNKPYGDLIKENQQLKCINKQLEERLGRSLALDMEECE